ncbi:MAG: trypsin-like serine protease [Candidatus Magnetomorum sp.]|nr:trypsin-like serine protease [Candidatus Magnetomorum sp.]
MRVTQKAISLLFIIFSIPVWATNTDLTIHTHSGTEKRIVGGTEVKRAFWPWMAALVERNTSPLSDAFFCGGILIHPRWMLTAAHCVENLLPYDFEVILNAHDLETDQGDPYPIRQILIHPEFDNIGLENDIALIQLKNAATYPIIQPMPSHDILPDVSGVVIGWGKLSEYGLFSTKLQQVNVPIVSNDVCQAAFQKDQPNIFISPKLICAGNENGGKDACHGDSGGPLILRHANNWVLAGIVSWGQGCARPGYYGVYTRVSMYLDFIEQNVPSITLTGQVSAIIDGQHSVAIPQAFIQLVDTEYKTYTNENGYYSFDVPSGIYNISINADKYLPSIRGINLCQRKKIVYYNLVLSMKTVADSDGNGMITLADIIAILQKISEN